MSASQKVQRTALRAFRVAIALFMLTQPIFGSAGASFAAAPLPRTGPATGNQVVLQQVLSVVEHRTKDEKVLEKIRKKLPELSDRELRLAASLCERISRDDSSAGANIAFSIVTAMIVLR